MSLELDAKVREIGTRFKIFPQPRFLKAFQAPEEVWISVPPQDIQPGPSDARMYVVDAANKLPYSDYYRPPFRGQAYPLVEPGPDGHFVHLEPGTRAFSAAMMYATVRRVLDIWEDYFGHQIAWFFEADFDRLELIPLIEWNNAQSGYGFLEFGYARAEDGGIDRNRPYCENFDVLAHELGHNLIFAEVGYPRFASDEALDYRGMHESAGDLVAIISSLHFDTVVTHLLDETCGNLFTVNELQRVGELSHSSEIRRAFNYKRMSDVGKEPHDRSLPLTGAIFDVMVEIFQKKLVARGLITEDLAKRSSMDPTGSNDLDALQDEFTTAYGQDKEGFKQCLLEARDCLGRLLATTWGSLRPDYLTYHDIVRALLRADRDLNNGAHHETIRSCFAWREISLAPNALLLQPHSVDFCGLSGHGLPKAVSQLDDASLSRLLKSLNEEAKARGLS